MVRVNSRKIVCFLLLACAVAALPASAQTFTSLASFSPMQGLGIGTLVQGFDGNFYSAAGYGGTSKCTGGCGTFFKVSPEGAITVIYNFEVVTQHPSSLALFTDGSFYGTSSLGGPDHVGSIFRVTPEGGQSQTTFDSTDGADPAFGVVLGADANFYGPTSAGGANGSGTFFRITPELKDLTSTSFPAVQGGWTPATLVLGADGNFYGTSVNGVQYVYGSVFKITPSGALTILHVFDDTDGFDPFGVLVQGTDGNFYGTTHVGGAFGDGTVFKISPGGTFKVVHSFDGTDGYLPFAGLIQGTDGNLYGTTSFGGANNDGTIFQITTAGALTTLYTFCSETNCADGANPDGALVQGTDGDFYGTTNAGGSNADGTVFKLSMGLGPFVTTVPTATKGDCPGMSVKILGTNLTGATSVTFNGTPAVFTVVSATEISTTVPKGATTGKIEVVTPGGTLTSNVAFRIL